jgi:multidrug efflux system membrane fusion protein
MKSKTLLLLCLLTVSCEKKTPPRERPLPLVKVETVISETIPITLESIGHVRPYYLAEIKAQVEGVLLETPFKQGDFVEEDDVLFVIDPSVYLAKRDQALADRERYEAQIIYAQEKVERYHALLKDSFVSTLDFIQYATELKTTLADLHRSEATLKLAETYLEYCTVKAPFSGRVGQRLVDKGNLIVNDGKTLLVLNKIDPIYIDFSIPEREFLKLQKYQRQTANGLTIKTFFPDYPDYPFTAKLIVIDNMINKETGMIPLRAEIHNKEELFWPGQFVRIKVVLFEEKNALMIPSSAVNIGQKGIYAFVVRKDNIAEYRALELGETLPNDTVQVLKGVAKDERVITRGQINVVPNQRVTIQP